MSWDVSVFSSNVDSIGYNDETQEMIVTWKNGKKSAYAGVSEEKALEVSKAPSVGSILNSEIKNSYPHRYI